MKYLVLATSLVALAACSQGGDQTGAERAATVAQSAASGPGADAHTHAHADFAGEWFGPEGTFVEIVPAGPGEYRLAIAATLDAPADGDQVMGRDAPDGIAFDRDGQTVMLRRATGDQTELTDLEGMTDCLMVQPGEGYCRRETAR